MKKTGCAVLLVLTLISCSENRTKEKYIHANDADSIVIGFYSLDKKDTRFIPQILDNAADPRESHSLEYKGRTIYRSKMEAMKRISGLNPPVEITDDPDTIIIEFYKKWANENGYNIE